MRKCCFLLLSVLLSLLTFGKVKGQGFFDFANQATYGTCYQEDASSWSDNVYLERLDQGTVDTTNRQYYLLETSNLINSLVFNDTLSWQTEFVLYEDTLTDEVIIRPYGYELEDVLFDFSLSIGDTIHSLLYSADNYDLSNMIVTQKDTVNINGVMRPRIVAYPSGVTVDGALRSEFLKGIGLQGGYLSAIKSMFYNGLDIYHDNTQYYFSCVPVGINEVQINIQTSPNPFQDILQLQFSEHLDGVISIIDIQGKQCHLEIMNGTSKTINLGFLNEGIYILIASNIVGEILARQKIIKQ
jgi:hypothetical protein